MATVIEQSRAIEIAESIQSKAKEDFQRGTLTRFARGQYQGMFDVVATYMELPTAIAERIERELDALCSLACKAEQ